ncbi:hypothetical protein [Pseudoroseomonas ludipueritiae]|uniref:Phage tail protein n=1 Tax=Pseudoroseomonas ludipueritiae TaxID=198093 RepID=A0ABR7R837_9PROT|nr:hypothetical protein [Pseudoroseomonas ludipueritiae]MBC9177846.1 hypothetical protein [Pseudoroseomonas ludipueritiae]MCG7363188.1 hypothetical protein [Roseomonas sp. ACRSG]
MANISLLWRKATDAGTVSGGAWRPTLPLQNLQTQDPQQVARSTSTAEASTWLRVDCGTGAPVPVSQFVLLNHNLTTAGRVRFVLSNAADGSAPLYDSGWLPAWEPTVVWGSLPWGAFPWNGVDTRAYPAGAALMHQVRTGTPYVARYVLVYLSDPSNPAGYLQAGRLMAGWSWSPAINAAWGASLRWVDPSAVKRTRGGRRIVSRQPKYRSFEMEFAALSEGEALGTAEAISRELGKDGDFFLCMDPKDSATNRFRRSIYANLTDTTPIVAAAMDCWTWRLSAEEII